GHGKRRVMKQSRSAFALLRITTAARWKLTLAWYGKWICRSAVCCRLWKLRGSPTTQSSFSPVITAASGFPTRGLLRERKRNCSKAAYAFLLLSDGLVTCEQAAQRSRWRFPWIGYRRCSRSQVEKRTRRIRPTASVLCERSPKTRRPCRGSYTGASK